jgi:hypothetical protein
VPTSETLLTANRTSDNPLLFAIGVVDLLTVQHGQASRDHPVIFSQSCTPHAPAGRAQEPERV